MASYLDFDPLPSLNEGDEHISLSDVISLRDAGLKEIELWAICRECCLALRSVHNSSEMFQTLCITPESLAFDASGSICFLDLASDPESLYVPPEYEKVGNSYKAHLYSLGMTMLFASEYNETSRKSKLSNDLKSILGDMTTDSYDQRADLESVLQQCDLKLKHHSSSRICYELAALGKLDSTMDDLSSISEDISLVSTASSLASSEPSSTIFNSISQLSISQNPALKANEGKTVNNEVVDKGSNTHDLIPPSLPSPKQPSLHDRLMLDIRQPPKKLRKSSKPKLLEVGDIYKSDPGLLQELASIGTRATDEVTVATIAPDCLLANNGLPGSPTRKGPNFRYSPSSGFVSQSPSSVSSPGFRPSPLHSPGPRHSPLQPSPVSAFSRQSPLTSIQQNAQAATNTSNTLPNTGEPSAFKPTLSLSEGPRMPSAFSSTATHFTPIILAKSPSLDIVNKTAAGTLSPKEKDKMVTKKLQELKKNLLKNKAPINFAKDIEKDAELPDNTPNTHNIEKPAIKTNNINQPIKSDTVSKNENLSLISSNVLNTASIPPSHNFMPQISTTDAQRSTAPAVQGYGQAPQAPTVAAMVPHMAPTIAAQVAPPVPSIATNGGVPTNQLPMVPMTNEQTGNPFSFPFNFQLQQDPKTGLFNLVPVPLGLQGQPGLGNLDIKVQGQGHSIVQGHDGTTLAEIDSQEKVNESANNKTPVSKKSSVSLEIDKNSVPQPPERKHKHQNDTKTDSDKNKIRKAERSRSKSKERSDKSKELSVGDDHVIKQSRAREADRSADKTRDRSTDQHSEKSKSRERSMDRKSETERRKDRLKEDENKESVPPQVSPRKSRMAPQPQRKAPVLPAKAGEQITPADPEITPRKNKQKNSTKDSSEPTPSPRKVKSSPHRKDSKNASDVSNSNQEDSTASIDSPQKSPKVIDLLPDNSSPKKAARRKNSTDLDNSEIKKQPSDLVNDFPNKDTEDNNAPKKKDRKTRHKKSQDRLEQDMLRSSYEGVSPPAVKDVIYTSTPRDTPRGSDKVDLKMLVCDDTADESDVLNLSLPHQLGNTPPHSPVTNDLNQHVSKTIIQESGKGLLRHTTSVDNVPLGKDGSKQDLKKVYSLDTGGKLLKRQLQRQKPVHEPVFVTKKGNLQDDSLSPEEVLKTKRNTLVQPEPISSTENFLTESLPTKTEIVKESLFQSNVLSANGNDNVAKNEQGSNKKHAPPPPRPVRFDKKSKTSTTSDAMRDTKIQESGTGVISHNNNDILKNTPGIGLLSNGVTSEIKDRPSKLAPDGATSITKDRPPQLPTYGATTKDGSSHETTNATKSKSSQLRPSDEAPRDGITTEVISKLPPEGADVEDGSCILPPDGVTCTSDAGGDLSPQSPTVCKDSGVSGLHRQSSGDSYLMEKLLSQESIKQQEKLGQITRLIRDEFAFDGYLENGIEDVAMAEYIASLANLKWETFTSAVSEKYCDLFWQEDLLTQLYLAVNGKQPVKAKPKSNPPLVGPTAKVLSVDEPGSPPITSRQLSNGKFFPSSAFKPIRLRNKGMIGEHLLRPRPLRANVYPGDTSDSTDTEYYERHRRRLRHRHDKSHMGDKKASSMENLLEDAPLTLSRPGDLVKSYSQTALDQAAKSDSELSDRKDYRKLYISESEDGKRVIHIKGSESENEAAGIPSEAHDGFISGHESDSTNTTGRNSRNSESVRRIMCKTVERGNSKVSVNSSGSGKGGMTSGTDDSLMNLSTTMDTKQYPSGQVIYFWTRDTKVETGLGEQVNRDKIESRISEIDQQINMEIKMKKKTQKYYRRLIDVHRENRATTEQKTMLAKVSRQIGEMNSKLENLVITKQYFEMMYADLWGLDDSFLYSLIDCKGPFQLQSCQHNPFLQYQSVHSSNTGGAKRSIQAGTPVGLLVYLFARNALREGYIHQFLYCYRYFVTPEQFLSFIVEKYSAATCGFSSNEELSMRVQNRACDIVQAWMEGYFSLDFKPNRTLLDLLQLTVREKMVSLGPRGECILNILEECVAGQRKDLVYSSDYLDKEDIELELVHDEENTTKWQSFKTALRIGPKVQARPLRPKNMASCLQRRNKDGSDGDIYFTKVARKSDSFALADYTSHTLADQLTLLEQALFQQCHPVHFLNSKVQGVGVSLATAGTRAISGSKLVWDEGQHAHSLFVGSYTQDAVTQLMIEHAQSLSYWVAAELVSSPSNKSQLALLIKFIHIAKICQEIRNYASCIAIVDGLENIIVRHLPAWRHLPVKSAQILEELSAVKLFLKDDNLGMMKDYHNQPTIPCILFFLVHVQQLELGGFTLANGMYKWAKMRSITKVIDQLRLFKQHKYSIEPNFDLQESLRTRMKEIVEQDLQTLASQNDTSLRSNKMPNAFRRMKDKLQGKD